MVNVFKATMERRRKRGKPSKGRRDEFEDDLNIVAINGQEMSRDHREWRKVILEAKVCNGLKKRKKKKKKCQEK
jgi:hypothetical protein